MRRSGRVASDYSLRAGEQLNDLRRFNSCPPLTNTGRVVQTTRQPLDNVANKAEQYCEKARPTNINNVNMEAVMGFNYLVAGFCACGTFVNIINGDYGFAVLTGALSLINQSIALGWR
mgnify:CR=1 FL=1